MAKKNKTSSPKLLSSFEEDLVWMSYRYCIGRHTIAANSHAKNLISYLPGRLSEKRAEFMSFDIRREIDNVLGTHYNFYIDTALQDMRYENGYNPLKFFNDFISTLSEWDELNKIKSVNINVYGNLSIEYYDDDEKNRYSYLNMLNDLVVWENLASLLDTKHHKTFKLKDPNTGEIILSTCFRGFHDVCGGEFVLKEVWIPVDRYIKNPYINTRIAEEYIID